MVCNAARLTAEVCNVHIGLTPGSVMQLGLQLRSVMYILALRQRSVMQLGLQLRSVMYILALRRGL